MRLIAIVQARMGSARLPGKVLKPLAGSHCLGRTVAAARKVPHVSEVVVATGEASANDAIAEWCRSVDVACFRGSEEDVLARMARTSERYGADAIIRLTADCPLLDPAVVSQAVELFRRGAFDYVCNVSPPQWPDGLDCEIVSARALGEADRDAVRPSDREHVTPFIRNNRSRFRVGNLPCPLPGMAGRRWTVDTAMDFERVERLLTTLTGLGRSPEDVVTWTDVLWAEDALSEEDSAELTKQTVRNEGYAKSLRADRRTGNRSPVSFQRSVTALNRAERRIPLGAQTFSKSRTQYPVGGAPLFLTAGQGARVWDVDGNEYVDLVNGLLCVSLGYCDSDVDAAVRAQLDRGVSFSLSTELEAELAERVAAMVPCAERVRFGKNGSDATSAAIRLARAFTGRDRVAICGYHGWHDWYIATTSLADGIPKAVRDLSHKFPYNDIEAAARLFAEHSGEIACIVMEPANLTRPEEGYLQALKDLAHSHGALLVFDEVITGFRFSSGGAQELFGVTPDLAAFGKGMANGFPISAVAGRADIMARFEDVFISGTFGGEALSLAAAIATLDKMRREPVVKRLWENGARLAEAVESAVAENGLGGVLSLAGFDPWRILAVQDHPSADAFAIKTFYITEMARRGVLTLGSHNMSYAMGDDELELVASAYADVLPILADKLSRGSLEADLDVPKLVPLFKVR